MRVNKIFFITIFMCAFTTGIVNARTLHFGDKTIALSQTKYTTPSLAFAIGNETWYAPMSPVLVKNTLHVRFNNETYSVNNCADRIFTDTTNYTYDNDGRLIGADENLWIQSTTEGYIDTNFVATGDTRIKTKYYNTTSSAKWFFGTRTSQNVNAFALQCAGGNSLVRNDYGGNGGSSMPGITGARCAKVGIFIVDKNKNVTTLQHPNGQTYTGTVGSSPSNFSTRYNLLILASNVPNISHSGNKFYYFQIYSDGADETTLVRNMVPVPACMRIGDFIVPENGMWDIVEQKFYGNANTTGTIIYGKDE